VHTTFSDCDLSPEDVLDEAGRIGLDTLAITDHDSVDGLPRALARGRLNGVAVIEGIELSGWSANKEIHIVGLFIDSTNVDLRHRLTDLHQARRERLGEMLSRLRPLGVAIEPAEVLAVAGPAAPGRMHVAEVIWKRGYVDSLDTAFVRFIGDDGPAYVPKEFFTPEECVELILSVGGVPILAHPGITQRDELIPGLVEAGLQGIEVFTPTHSPMMVEWYMKVAEKHGLAISGGSDFHGSRKPDIALGCATVPHDRLAELRRRARQAVRLAAS